MKHGYSILAAAIILSGCNAGGGGIYNPDDPYKPNFSDPGLASELAPGGPPLKIHSSGVKLDPDGTAAIADDGNRVTGIEHLDDAAEGTEKPLDPVLGISYKRNGADRNVTFRRGDFGLPKQYGPLGNVTLTHDGYSGHINNLGDGFGIRAVRKDPKKNAKCKPPWCFLRPATPGDSPYDINQYGWWEHVTLPYVAVAALVAGGGPEGFDVMQQRHFVIAGPGTSSDEMPVTGTASYAGVFRSRSYRQDSAFPHAHYQRISGAVNLDFDFEASTLAGSIDDVSGLGPAQEIRPENWNPWATSSFAIEGTISDTGFTGTLAGSDSDPTTPDVESARGYAGNIEGGFFGPGAANLGAAVTATRDLGGTENDRALFGYIVGARND